MTASRLFLIIGICLAAGLVTGFAQEAAVSEPSTGGKAATAKKTEEELVADFNKRIDRLEIMSDEIVIRAQNLRELEMVVRHMESKYVERLNRIHAKKTLAEDTYAILEGAMDIATNQKEINDIKQRLKVIRDEKVWEKKSYHEKLVTLLGEQAKTPNNAAQNSELYGNLMKRARVLQLENEYLKTFSSDKAQKAAAEAVANAKELRRLQQENAALKEELSQLKGKP